MKKKSIVHKITKIIVDISLILGVILVVLTPYLMKEWTYFFRYDLKKSTDLMIIIILSGVAALYLLWQLRTILKLVVAEKVFTDKTVHSLRKIALSSVFIALIYFVKLWFGFSIITFLIMIVFCIATLIFLTLKDVFKEAISYKEENDWTV